MPEIKTITPRQALSGQEWAVISSTKVGIRVYDLFRTQDAATRICNDLNKRYRDICMYYVAHIE